MFALAALPLAYAADPVRLPVQVGEKYGFIDETGALVIPATYDATSDFADGKFAFETGVVVTGDLHDHTAATWGYADAAGEIVVPPTWLAARAFSEGRAQVKCPDGHWATLDPSGQRVVPCALLRTTPYAEGRAVVEIGDDRWAVLDASGRQVFALPPEADCSDPPGYADGVLALDVGAATRYLGLSGETLFEVAFRARDFSEGRAPFRDAAGGWGYLGKDGAVAIPATFDWVGAFAEGRAPVEVNGKMGYIDRSGQIVIAAKFARARAFSEGLAVATLDGTTFGYLDPSGAWAIAPRFRDAEDARMSFNGGFATVKQDNGRKIWIDRTGAPVGTYAAP